MTVSGALARPMLAGMFIYGGVDALRDPISKAKAADDVAPMIAEALKLPTTDTVTLVRINGGIQVVAGTLLALGKARRLSALVLAASLVPTTYAGHRFWDEVDEEQRARQRVQFLKNMAMLGGLVLAAGDTGGRPSVPWQARRAAQHALEAAAAAVPATQAATQAATQGAAKTAQHAAQHAQASVKEAQEVAVGALSFATNHARELTSQAAHLAQVAQAKQSDLTAQMTRRAQKAAKQARQGEFAEEIQRLTRAATQSEVSQQALKGARKAAKKAMKAEFARRALKAARKAARKAAKKARKAGPGRRSDRFLTLAPAA